MYKLNKVKNMIEMLKNFQENLLFKNSKNSLENIIYEKMEKKLLTFLKNASRIHKKVGDHFISNNSSQPKYQIVEAKFIIGQLCNKPKNLSQTQYFQYVTNIFHQALDRLQKNYKPFFSVQSTSIDSISKNDVDLFTSDLFLFSKVKWSGKIFIQLESNIGANLDHIKNFEKQQKMNFEYNLLKNSIDDKNSIKKNIL